MKIKTSYIYIFIILLAVIFLIYFTQNSNSSNNISEASKQNIEIPNDEIHKNLTGQIPVGAVTPAVQRQLDSLKTYVNNNPKDIASLRQYSELLTASHKINEALKYWEKLLQLNQDNPNDFLTVSFIYFNKGDYKNSEKYLNELIVIDKNNTEALYNLGVVYSAKGEVQKAKKIWQDLINNHKGTQMALEAQKALNTLK